MKTRISPSLIRHETEEGSRVCCAACEHPLTPAGSQAHWKDHAALKTQPVSQLPGWSSSVHPDLELREFVCGSCGQLLDSEMALREDPFLYDVVDG